MQQLTAWQRAVAATGVAKTAAGVVLVIVTALATDVSVPPRMWLMVANMLCFGIAGSMLLFGARRDGRAAKLGAQLVLTASAFADSAPALFADEARPAIGVARAVFAVPIDALGPYFFWAFVAAFPRLPDLGRWRHALTAAVGASLTIGIVCLLVSVAHLFALRAGTFAFASPLWIMAESASPSIYWILMYTLSLSAIVALVLRGRTAAADERRRIRLLVLGLAAGATPAVVWTISALVSSAFMRAMPLRVVGWVIYPALLSVPFSIAYAVLVHHALDVRLVVRRALQYALTRQTLIVLAATPFVALLAQLYLQRDTRVGTVLGGANGLTLLALAALGVAALRGRRMALERLDRRFFREQFDAQIILGQLVARVHRASSASEVSDVVRTEIDRALHLNAAHLLVTDSTGAGFVSLGTDVRTLGADSGLVSILQERDGPVEAAVDSAGSLFSDLAETDQLWLTDAGARLLVPLKGADHRLLGILVLGDKRSELPYSSDDRKLLVTVASAVALSLSSRAGDAALRSPTTTPSSPTETVHSAVECTACGTLYPAPLAECRSCGHLTIPAPVPLIVAGKFRVRQRVGRGAMGVVYRAVDLALDRPVAIKTLPRLQPEQAARLRREARAIASLSHPGLAAIYGAESWLGTPILVLEYLPGGTLADRLAKGPMRVGDVLSLGILLADALRAIHRAGVLHRDIKPSNIGFAADGSPRILDFGIARLLSGAARVDPWSQDARQEARAALGATDDASHATTTAEGLVVGTPLYMSPEAVSADEPRASFDVWSLCVVLYEALAGANPMRDVNVPRILRRILACDVPALSRHLPEAPEPLVQFFAEAFHVDARNRPADAAALIERLESLRRQEVLE